MDPTQSVNHPFYSVKKVFAAACCALAIFGVTMFALGALLPPLTKEIPEAVTLPPMLSIGILIGTMLFGPVVDKWGYKWLLVASIVMTFTGLLGLMLLKELNLLRVCIIFFGLGGGIINGETSALVSDIYDDTKRGKMMSLFSTFYCIGALLWSFVCSFIDYMIPLTVVLVLIAVLALFCLCIKFPAAKPKENVSFKKSVGLLKYPMLLLFSAVLFFQSGFEGISGNYTSSFLTNNGINQNIATFSLTMMTIGMFLGRWVLGGLMQKLKLIEIITGYLLLALIGSGLMWIAPKGIILAYISTTLIGFGAGATFPVILTYLGGAFKQLSGTAFSIAMFIALCGNFLFNFTTGQTFKTGSHAFFPAYLVIAVAIMLILLPIATRSAAKFKSKE